MSNYSIKGEHGFVLDLGLPENFSVSVNVNVKELDALTREYALLTRVESASALEELKRRFLLSLQTFVRSYSMVLAHKGTNHIFFEDAEKSVRSYCINKITEAHDKVSTKKLAIAKAESLVRSDREYMEFMFIISKSREFMIRTETFYKFYTKTLDSIVQSISTFKAAETQNKTASNQ